MALDVQRLRLTNDHTLESASEVMSQLQFERRLPNGRNASQQLLRSLGFRSNQDGVEHKQFVFQGQCLILGDARVGKTSLKKSLMGKPFDADEPGTKGVEMSFVDRKWRNLHSLAGLKFGSFTRFRESVLYQGIMFGPGGVEFAFDQEFTSAMSTLAVFFSILLRIGWLISMIWLLTSELAFTTVSVAFYSFSVAVLCLEILLQFEPEHHNFVILISFLFNLRRFLIGFQTAHLLAGIFRETKCHSLGSTFGVGMFSFSQFIWIAHMFLVALLVNGIFTNFSSRMGKHFNFCTWKGAESALPGQVKFNSSVPFLPELFLLMIPVVGGVSFGCAFELLVNMTPLEYCNILHFTMVPIFWVVAIRLAQTFCSWANLQNINFLLVLFIVMQGMREHVQLSLTSFCKSTTYAVLFAIWACCTLYKDWDSMFFLLNDPVNVRATQASFTFIFIEKVLLNFQKLREALHNMFSSLKLKILDFSGDEEYYAYHHIFLRDQAIYIVVFNMANFADDNFRNVVAKIQRISFWLESICSKAASKTPIFLVGTHRGHMDKTRLKSIDNHLRQNLLDSFDDELVRNDNDNLLYFPIENSHGKNDRGVQILQRKIMSTAEEHKTTMGREIPFSWIKIQDAIINQRKNKKAKFCVTLEQFPISVGNFICSNWSKETLKYFHEKGLVIYVDPGSSLETQGFNREGDGEDDPGQDSKLSNWILLKPEILIDIIIQLVTPLTEEEEEETSWHGCRRDLKLLQNTGMLTDSLLRKFLSRWKENEEAIKGFLEEYDIICPLFYNVKNKEEAKVTHFVPSLLPLSVDGNTPVWHDDPTDKRFFVFFKRFLPDPLFHHLLSRAHSHSKAGFPQGQPVISRDAGMFWFTPTQPYRLLVLKKENMIEVTFSCRDGQGMRPSDVLSVVFIMVQGICQRHFPYVTFHCGPACPSDKCPGYQGDYISHPGVQKSSSRLHVFNVLPARQEDSISSFYCGNQNFENDFKDWLL